MVSLGEKSRRVSNTLWYSLTHTHSHSRTHSFTHTSLQSFPQILLSTVDVLLLFSLTDSFKGLGAIEVVQWNPLINCNLFEANTLPQVGHERGERNWVLTFFVNLFRDADDWFRLWVLFNQTILFGGIKELGAVNHHPCTAILGVAPTEVSLSLSLSLFHNGEVSLPHFHFLSSQLLYIRIALKTGSLSNWYARNYSVRSILSKVYRKVLMKFNWIMLQGSKCSGCWCSCIDSWGILIWFLSSSLSESLGKSVAAVVWGARPTHSNLWYIYSQTKILENEWRKAPPLWNARVRRHSKRRERERVSEKERERERECLIASIVVWKMRQKISVLLMNLSQLWSIECRKSRPRRIDL